jgi:serine/threonine-protein kinase
MVSAPVVAAQSAPMKAPGPGKALWVGLGILLVGMAAFAAVMLMPSNGSIVIAVSGPGNRAIDSVQVLVDGKKLCDTSPCVANGIPAGTHFVKVQAPGYATPSAHAVKVVRGDEAVVNLQLSPAGEGTVLKVSGEGSGLKLFIDGKEMGPLPQEVKDLTPGDHTIRVDGGNRFEAYEEKVTIVADQARSIGPLALKVRRGTANIEAGSNADGAKVLLVAGSEKRQIPRLPYKVDIDTTKGYQIVATKKGFATTTIPVTFEPGKDQKLFTIHLGREGEAPPAAAAEHSTSSGTGAVAAADPEPEAAQPEPESAPAAPARTPAPTGGDPRKARLAASTTSSTTSTKTATAAAAPAAAGQGTLNINSIPQSNVLLDGRPLGKTPRAGVSVPGGSHTVVFIHPEHGRKQVVVTVIPGRTATAAVRFP